MLPWADSVVRVVRIVQENSYLKRPCPPQLTNWYKQKLTKISRNEPEWTRNNKNEPEWTEMHQNELEQTTMKPSELKWKK